MIGSGAFPRGLVLLCMLGDVACRAPSPPRVESSLQRETVRPVSSDAGDDPADETSRSGGTGRGAARDLWFPSGPGRDAIVARERRDFDTAVERLDQLLASSDLEEADRAAASILRGLEAVREERFEMAADLFAVASGVPQFSTIAPWIAVWEAQARLDAGQPDRALAIVAAVDLEPGSSPLVDDLWVIEADAKARTKDPQGAIASYRRYLDRLSAGRRRFEVQAKLARVLAALEVPEASDQAIELYEHLWLETPLSDFGEEAQRQVPKLRAAAGSARDGKRAAAFAREVEIATIEALVARRRFAEVVPRVDLLLEARGRLTPSEACRVLYAQGTAVFRLRRRTDARPIFDRAAEACAKAGPSQRSEEVKSRYQAARGRFAEGAYTRAARAFEALATSFPDHSYCDDAWLLAGEAWEAASKPGQARAAYRHAMDVHGDQFEEAQRRILVQLFAAGEHAKVVGLADDALASVGSGATAAKLHYFRGRALALQGDHERARGAWADTLRVHPMGYEGLLALSRLHDLGAEALAEGLEVLQAQTGDPWLEAPPSHPAAVRAALLARLGLGDAAHEELEFAGIGGWDAAATLHRAGLFAESQRILASTGATWRRDPPNARTRARWELAYPRPFEDLVVAYEKRHSVPGDLAFAVMQTESRFDPGVTSLAGARGLIQLMPSTAQWVAEQAGLERLDPDTLYDPATNLDLGIRYLAGLVARYGGDDAAVTLAVPSYNAGPGAVDRWLAEHGDWDLDLFIEAIPYDETRKYTQHVLARWWAYRWLYAGSPDLERVPWIPLTIPKARRAG